jgi:hypothetical protein
MPVTLGDKRPSYSTVNNWVARFSRDPGDIPGKSKLYYSRDFRHEKALSQMGSQMSQC